MEQRKLSFAIGVIAIAVLLYLFVSEINPKVLVCPANGVINCGRVITSEYSNIFGVPVSVLGIIWFTAMIALSFSKNNRYLQLLVPLWAAGIVFVIYLVSAELFFLHSICIYCSSVDILILLMGIPALKLGNAKASV